MTQLLSPVPRPNRLGRTAQQSAALKPVPALESPSGGEAQDRTRPPRLSCVVPCWNEATNLAQLLPQLATTLTDLCEEWEVVLVDDGSTDGTQSVLADWARRPGFRALQLSRNFGKEAALTAGDRKSVV